MISFAEAISISELCVYLPTLILTIILIFRQGFQKQFGWIFLTKFCVIRLIGAGLKIASLNDPTSKPEAEWSAIFNAVGISALLMCALGLLKRIIDQSTSTRVRPNTDAHLTGGFIGKLLTGKGTSTSQRARLIQLTSLPAMIGFILCIVGGIDAASSSASKRSTGSRDSKIGIAIFCAIYVLLAVLVFVTAKDASKAEQGEKRIYVVVAIALPFICVRLVWSILAVYAHNKDFSVVSGKPIIQLCMATIMEFIVVVLFLGAGLTAVGRRKQEAAKSLDSGC